MNGQSFYHENITLDIIYLRFEQPLKYRYYRVALARDMFDDWVITKVWGGINQANGRIVHVPYIDLNQALAALKTIVSTRTQRGYCLKEKHISMDPSISLEYLKAIDF